MDEVHVLRRQRQRLPVEPTFQQQRPPGVARALIAVLQLRFQPRVLLAGQVAGAARVDERARRPRCVVEQRLVPGARRVVNVYCVGGGLDRAQLLVLSRVSYEYFSPFFFSNTLQQLVQLMVVVSAEQSPLRERRQISLAEQVYGVTIAMMRDVSGNPLLELLFRGKCSHPHGCPLEKIR
jgi:hypothetical protein